MEGPATEDPTGERIGRIDRPMGRAGRRPAPTIGVKVKAAGERRVVTGETGIEARAELVVREGPAEERASTGEVVVERAVVASAAF